VQNTDLRPLGAGEILDRAVTLYVRRFVVIATVLAIVIVPLVLLQAIVAPGAFRVSDDLMQILQAGGSTAKSAAVFERLARDSQLTGAGASVTLAGLLLHLLMWNALVAVIAGAYTGIAVTAGTAYALAVRRWLAQLVVGLAFIAIALIALIPLAIAYVAIIAVAVGLVAVKLQVVAIIVGIVLGLAFVVFAAAVAAWGLMAYELASVAVVTESSNPVTAVASGLRRAFGRGTRWRTLVAGLVYIVLTYAASIPVIAVAGLMSVVSHQPLISAGASAVASVLLQGLLGAFVVVYATDVRVRREGLDLAALAEAPA
jgi:hypothetical protein